MTARTDEIETAMLAEFKAHDIEDTPANRHAFLEGLRDAWNEPFLDELAAFPKGAFKDRVDSCSSAFNNLRKIVELLKDQEDETEVYEERVQISPV